MMIDADWNPAVVNELLPDWPAGPLDEYRRRASFNWKEMRLLLDSEDVIRFKNRVYKAFEDDPAFRQSSWDEFSRDEQRQMTLIRLRRLLESRFGEEEMYISNPYLVPAFVQTIGQYNWSLLVKRVLSHEYFIANARTEKREQKTDGELPNSHLLTDLKTFNALGAISITEMAHGSDTKNLQTTASFRPSTQEFILNTPSLSATKVWSGVLGQCATHALVFAQLYTPDGVCHGLHSFLVSVRDPNTLRPYDGVIIGDMGAKIGLNGVDNGFMTFKNYAIPKSAMMRKGAGTVTADGQYVEQIKQSGAKVGTTLGILSTGRVIIYYMSITNIQLALTIAIRYSAVRKQFGPAVAGGHEWPVLEYQTQQWRLLPYIAAGYVLNNSFFSLYRDYVDFFVTSYNGNSSTCEMGAEIHALSSCAKSVGAWIARDAIQEAREACGGHGYLKAARLGELRNDHDANNTYEGDNNVLLQQTSNYLLKLFKDKLDAERGGDTKTVRSPFGSVDFINNYQDILRQRFNGSNSLDCMHQVVDIYHFLVCYLLKESHDKYTHLMHLYNGDTFRARNDCQIYYLRSLAIAFFECNTIERYAQFCDDQQIPDSLRTVLIKLGLLFALWSLDKHLVTLYEARYFSIGLDIDQSSSSSSSSSSNANESKPVAQIQQRILTLCAELKDEALALVDAVAPPDFVLNSCLAHSDGRVYEHIFDAMTHSKGAFERPSWYKEFTEAKLYRIPTAKL